MTSVKADRGIVFEPLQPVADRKVLFCEELIPVFLLLIKSDIIDSSLETYSLKYFNGKVLICRNNSYIEDNNFFGPIMKHEWVKIYPFLLIWLYCKARTANLV